jgi:threonylcarbamoyladenosine tRNA methylthiotransferase MtaB
MTTVTTVFVGCKVSLADSDDALGALLAAGLRAVARDEDADLVVVHTCCVTAEAERKSRRLVRRMAGAGRRVVVAGCAATLRPRQFEGPGVELLGERPWAALAAEVEVFARHKPALRPSAAGSLAPAPGARRRTRAVVKVQDGCGGRCSYCAVRLVRGRPRSRPLAEVVEAAGAAIARGCGEIVLSGIDLGSWSDGDRRLADLVEALTASAAFAPPGPAGRLRLSSLEPRHLDDRLLEALAHPCVARHLHVPLQSADDGVLADMGRPYTFAEYDAALGRVRARLGRAMLSTDVIVGFPTEGEAAFRRTQEALESGRFGRVHVFAYSPRPGTAAARLPLLPAAVVKDRRARALAAAEAAARAARRAALGRPAEVLVEDRRDGLGRGYSSEYIRYFVRGPARRGQLVGVVADGEHEDGVIGTVKEPGA